MLENLDGFSLVYMCPGVWHLKYSFLQVTFSRHSNSNCAHSFYLSSPYQLWEKYQFVTVNLKCVTYTQPIPLALKCSIAILSLSPLSGMFNVTNILIFCLVFTLASSRGGYCFSRGGGVNCLCESLKSKRAALSSFTAWVPAARSRAPVGSRDKATGGDPGGEGPEAPRFNSIVNAKYCLNFFCVNTYLHIFTYRKTGYMSPPPPIRK